MATSRSGKPIVIAEYDPRWPPNFRAERALILRAVGEQLFVRVEHVGSTAVPGLAAKPIIDLMPGVCSLDHVTQAVIERLAIIGYEYVPEYERPNDVDEGTPERRYFRKDVNGARAFHMHLVAYRSEWWRDHLRFRNWLRAFARDRDAYAELKRRIAADYNARMDSTWGSTELNLQYTERKSAFVADVLERMRARIERSAPIVLEPYDPSWAARYERERERIDRAAGDLFAAIEHVGSTAVPGFEAKPKIDIAAGLRSMQDLRAAIDALRPLGYDNHDDPPDAPIDWYVLVKREDGEKSVNLHLVPHGGRRWREYVAFRDHLRAHPDAAAEYAQLKRMLAEEFGRDRIGYPEAKADFVASILEKAQAS